MYEGAQTYFKMKSTEVAPFQYLCSQESLRCTAVASTQPCLKTASGPLWASTVSWGPGNI